MCQKNLRKQKDNVKEPDVAKHVQPLRQVLFQMTRPQIRLYLYVRNITLIA